MVSDCYGFLTEENIDAYAQEIQKEFISDQRFLDFEHGSACSPEDLRTRLSERLHLIHEMQSLMSKHEMYIRNLISVCDAEIYCEEDDE